MGQQLRVSDPQPDKFVISINVINYNLSPPCLLKNKPTFLSLNKILDLEKIEQHIEALIFSAENPIGIAEIKGCLEEVFDILIPDEIIQEGMNHLIEKYKDEHYSFCIFPVAGGYQFMTKGAFHNTVGTFLKQSSKKRLSKAALETLSIIAYKQPVTKHAVESIRGVNCDYAIQKLLEKELILIIGRSETIGKPLLYGTSEKFMEYFGLNSLTDLPVLKDVTQVENEIGKSESGEELSENTVVNNTEEE